MIPCPEKTCLRPETVHSHSTTTSRESQPLAQTTADNAGLYSLEVMLEKQGFVRCHPPGLERLMLESFVTTVGQVAGDAMSNKAVGIVRRAMASGVATNRAEEVNVDYAAAL